MSAGADTIEPQRAAGAVSRGPKVVALGGGHGLYVALRALRHLTERITAVVTVADDGGSSGRIRRQFDILPPGDLRMALAALAAQDDAARAWTSLFQHRLGGNGTLAGHPVGNLVLTGLLETIADPVEALAVAARSMGVQGRVLPMSEHPLDLVATVETIDRDDPVRRRRIRGQSAIADALGRVHDIELVPADAPACGAAVEAVAGADAVLLGPGSWFTSVLPHVLLPDLATALSSTPAPVVVALNLAPQPGETDGFSAADHVRVLHQYCPDLGVAVVLADNDTDGLPDLTAACAAIGASLVTAPLRAAGAGDRHDPRALAAALRTALPGRWPEPASSSPTASAERDLGRAVRPGSPARRQ